MKFRTRIASWKFGPFEKNNLVLRQRATFELGSPRSCFHGSVAVLRRDGAERALAYDVVDAWAALGVVDAMAVGSIKMRTSCGPSGLLVLRRHAKLVPTLREDLYGLHLILVDHALQELDVLTLRAHAVLVVPHLCAFAFFRKAMMAYAKALSAVGKRK